MKALWYGEIDDPMHWAARDIRRTAELIELGRQETEALAAQYQTIIGGLHARDPDFHSEDIASLVDAVRALRSVAGT